MAEIIKQNLKDARDAIAKEEYEEAIKLTKNVLRADNQNYMALVLLGKALLNSEQAPLAFKKAISINEEKTLAWQGLANYYEKNYNLENGIELAKIYRLFLKCEEDLTKFEVICKKYYENALKTDTVQVCEILYDYCVELDFNEKRNLCFNTLRNILTNIGIANSKPLIQMFEKIFLENPTVNIEFVLKYFNCLSFFEGFDKTFTKCIEFLQSHDCAQLKNWLMQSFTSFFIMEKCLKCEDSFIYEIEKLMDDHVSTDIKSFVEAIVLFIQKDYFNSYKVSFVLNSNNTDNYTLSIFHGHVCLKLQRWLEAESVSKTIINQMDPVVRRTGISILFISLANRSDAHSRAINLHKEHNLKNMSADEYKALFLAYLHSDKIIEAEECLNSLETTPEYHCFKALLFKKRGKLEEAVSMLSEHKESSPMCLFELVLHYWENKEYEPFLMHIMQLAKIDKNNYEIFIKLGDYYKMKGDIEKSNKCYLKAYTLNSESSQAGKGFSQTNKFLEKWELNLEFLQNASKIKSVESSWVYLELGSQYINLEKWDDAIVSLRIYMRYFPKDANGWELLGDAYCSRGSYNSSVKCYKRAVELEKNRNYSLVQIGTVQCLLGELTDALATYQSIDDKEYLSALKGMADVYYAIAKEKLSSNFFGACRDNAQEAVFLLSKAILKGHHFVCLWSSLSHAIAMIGKLPPKYRYLYIHEKFCCETYAEELNFVKDENIFDLAIKCFCKAIKLSSTTESYLYHELSSIYYAYYNVFHQVPAIQKAFACIKKCLSLDTSNWQIWNSLGLFCMTDDIQDYALAQHAFIKSINIEYCNANAWTNLGCLYFKFGEKIMANKCFQIAQQVNPSFLNSWVGQALIAESVGDSETIDLFRHACQLGYHKESALGYAQWVCDSLMNMKNKSNKTDYSINNMHAVPVSHDFMTWLTEYEQSDPCGLNILGVLQLKLGLIRSAAKTFEKATLLDMEPHNRDILLVNYGRSLYMLGKHDSALNVFKSVSEASVNSAVGLALTYYKKQNYQEAYNIYGKALQWLSTDDDEKAQLLVAMASMIYKSHPEEIDECKTLLFQSIQYNENRVCIPGLLATYALSCLHSDLGLSQLVINEFNKLKDKDAYSHYIGFFESLFLLKQNLPVKAIRKLSSFLHTSPDSAYLWRIMSLYCSSNTLNKTYIASRSAQKAIALQPLGSNSIECYKVASIAEMCMGNAKRGLIFAQKAIHLRPDCAENWALLVFVLTPSKRHRACEKMNLKNLIDFIKNSLNPSKSLINWLSFFERHILVN